jgi:hypothetical protein
MSTNGQIWTCLYSTSPLESIAPSRIKDLQRFVVSGHSPGGPNGEPQANDRRTIKVKCTYMVGYDSSCATMFIMKSDRLVVQMEPALKKALEVRSKQTGVPISEFVRRALVESLRKSK